MKRESGEALKPSFPLLRSTRLRTRQARAAAREAELALQGQDEGILREDLEADDVDKSVCDGDEAETGLEMGGHDQVAQDGDLESDSREDLAEKEMSSQEDEGDEEVSVSEAEEEENKGAAVAMSILDMQEPSSSPVSSHASDLEDEEEEEKRDESSDIIADLIKNREDRRNAEEWNEEDDDGSEKGGEESLTSSVSDEEERALELSLFGHLETKKLRAELQAAKESLVVEDDNSKSKVQKRKGPAWKDEDDDDVRVDLNLSKKTKRLRRGTQNDVISGSEYSKRLREQFVRIHGEATWAKPRTYDADDEEEDAILRSSDRLTRSVKTFRRLPLGKLRASRLNDANQHGVSKSVVQSVSWHKDGELFATGGLDKKLRIFSIDGKLNKAVETVYFQDMPIFNAQFAGSTHDQVIACGRRPFFYWVDLNVGVVNRVPGILGRDEKSLETMAVSPDGSLLSFIGNDGHVLLVSQKSKQLVGNVKMNEGAHCATFSSDGNHLYSGGNRGRVYCWDLRTRRLMYHFQDKGSLWTRSLAVAAQHGKIAVGSSSGVVNVYDLAELHGQRRPEPEKEVMSLVTAVDGVSFNHDGQLLAFFSRRKRDAFRLLNMNTMTVVQNWPTSNTPVHYASAVAFSPRSDMITVGNDRGRCLLYKLHHFAEN